MTKCDTGATKEVMRRSASTLKRVFTYVGSTGLNGVAGGTLPHSAAQKTGFAFHETDNNANGCPPHSLVG